MFRNVVNVVDLNPVTSAIYDGFRFSATIANPENDADYEAVSAMVQTDGPYSVIKRDVLENAGIPWFELAPGQHPSFHIPGFGIFFPSKYATLLLRKRSLGIERMRLNVYVVESDINTNGLDLILCRGFYQKYSADQKFPPGTQDHGRSTQEFSYDVGRSGKKYSFSSAVHG